MNGVVSASVQTAMWACIAVLTVLPVAVLIASARKAEMNLSAVILGLMAYIVFDTILLVTVFDELIFNTLSPGLRDVVFSSAGGFTVYYSCTRALFYTAAFYLSSRITMKSDTNGAGLAIASGFIAGKLILNGAYQIFQSLRTVWVLNAEGIDGYVAQAVAEGASEADIDKLNESITNLMNSTPSDFMFAGAETVMLGVILFAIGYVIHLACTHRAPIGFMYVSMAILAASYIAPTLLTTGSLERIAADLVTLAVAIAVVIYSVFMGRKYGKNDMKW